MWRAQCWWSPPVPEAFTDAEPDLNGTDVEVVAVWEDAEAAAFEAVLAEFEARTGAEVIFTSTAGRDITGVLDERLATADPPDLAVLPQPGLLERYAGTGAILPVDDIVGEEVRAGWAPVWQRLATVDGRLCGVWFKAANKSLVWYSRAFSNGPGSCRPMTWKGWRPSPGRWRQGVFRPSR